MSASRLFVLRAGAIGDFVLTLPALQALRARFPSHALFLAARSDVLPLVHGTLAGEVIAFDDERLAPLFAPDLHPSSALRNIFDGVDLAIVWLPERSARVVAGNLRRLDVARLVSASPLPERRHAADHLLDTLAPLGIGAAQFAAIPRLRLPPLTVEAGSRYLGGRPPSPSVRIVAMHIGSGGAHKRWSVENFLSLAARLVAAGDTHVLLLSGPAETIGELNLPPQVSHLRDVPLLELSALLGKCRLYLGADSGITHLAAALGVPTLALFGPTDPAIWGPRGERVTILRSATHRMADLAPDEVWPAVCQAMTVDG